MYRVAVIEDDAAYRALIAGFLMRYGKEQGLRFEIDQYADGEDFIRAFKGQYQILFLDILMDGLNGIETAQIIRKTDENIVLIYITNMVQYAVKGYGVSAADFIVKPVSYYAFQDHLQRVIHRMRRAGGAHIQVKTSQGLVKLDVGDIRYIETQNRRLSIHLGGESYCCSMPLQRMEDMLPAGRFFRCHSAYLVNLEYVERIDKLSALVDGREVYVSKYQKKGFVEAWTNYLGNKI